jgi:Tfp pilus assembly protein PilO
VQVKTKNLMVGVLVVVLVGALWYRVVYSPMESKASKAKTAAQVADATSARLRRSLEDFSGAKKRSNDALTGPMLAAVPVDSAEASFLRTIDALRISSGADWQSITPAAPVLSGTLSTITVGIAVQGTEVQLMRYLAGLADSKRLFVVDSVTVSQGGTTGTTGTGSAAGGVFSGGKLQMQISGRIFSQPGAVVAPLGATGTAAGATTPATGAPAPPGA